MYLAVDSRNADEIARSKDWRAIREELNKPRVRGIRSLGFFADLTDLEYLEVRFSLSVAEDLERPSAANGHRDPAPFALPSFFYLIPCQFVCFPSSLCVDLQALRASAK